jgi:putative addiction module component (TIGR02574 family)
MSEEAVELLRRARCLNAAERAELVDALIKSLDAIGDESVQAAWDAEIIRRLEDLNAGKVKPISLEEARRRLSTCLD